MKREIFKLTNPDKQKLREFYGSGAIGQLNWYCGVYSLLFRKLGLPAKAIESINKVHLKFFGKSKKSGNGVAIFGSYFDYGWNDDKLRYDEPRIEIYCDEVGDIGDGIFSALSHELFHAMVRRGIGEKVFGLCEEFGFNMPKNEEEAKERLLERNYPEEVIKYYFLRDSIEELAAEWFRELVEDIYYKFEETGEIVLPSKRCGGEVLTGSL